MTRTGTGGGFGGCYYRFGPAFTRQVVVVRVHPWGKEGYERGSDEVVYKKKKKNSINSERFLIRGTREGFKGYGERGSRGTLM